MERVRLDRWLWAARFYKTRSLAAAAIAGGKVHVNDERPKRAKLVGVGDLLSVRLGPYEFVVRVTGLSERRGSAKHAAVLYEEDPTAKTLRLRLAEQLRVAPPPTFEGKGRPTKRDRREIDEISNWSGGPGADSDLDEPDSA